MSTKTISDLPVEVSLNQIKPLKLIFIHYIFQILIKIFELLQPVDLLNIPEVCHDWLQISQIPALMQITKISKSDAVDCFLQSFRKFKFSLKFQTNLPVNYFQFTYKFSEFIHELRFFDICLSSYYNFIVNVTNLKNLRYLDINLCSFNDEVCSKFPTDLSLNLNSLRLMISFDDDNKIIKGSETDFILSIIPNLEILTCNFGGDYGFQRAIINYLKNPELTKSLKELHFTSFGNDNLLSSVFRINHLSLEKFFWLCFREIDFVSDVEDFLSSQKNLKVLDLVSCGTSLRKSILKISSKINLEQLTFSLNDEIIQNSHLFEHLWNIKNLEIFCCNSSIFKSLKKISKVEELTLFCYVDDLSQHQEKFKFLTGLKSLHVSQSLINDTLLQAVFKNLINLRSLFLIDNNGNESKITDFGITGSCNGYPLSRLENLEEILIDVKACEITDESLRQIESSKNIRKAFIPRSAIIKSSKNPIFRYLVPVKKYANKCLD